METLNYNNITYIHSDYILENAPIYSKGSRGARNLIKNKDIKEDNFIYAKKQENEWVICNGKSTKFDKVFFKYDIIEQIPELNNKDIITDDNGIEKAPKIIYLTDNEKFQDNEGNVLEIETRGERNVNNCFFKVKDVSKAFGIENLQNTILDKKTKYKLNIDYKFFMCEKINKDNNKINYKTICKKELFLMYHGVLRTMFNMTDCRTKELNIVNIIKENINVNWKCNKPLKSLYRPDLITITDKNILIVEIDENQHKYYDNESEDERIKIIYTELGKKPTTVIRINPDFYIDYNNVSHDGISKDTKEFNLRMTIIINEIKKQIDIIPTNLNIIKLFFNGYELIDKLDNKTIFEYQKNKKYDRMQKIISTFLKNNFIYQLGTVEQKNKLVSQIKGVSYESIQELFSINAREMPCVYLTAFNTVSILRDTMNIDNSYTDDSIVYKFGLTKSFEQRKNGHKSEYKSIDKLIDKKLVYFTYIDPLYISEAETEIKNMLNDYKISWELHDELVVIPNNMLKFVKTIYENIGMKYSGHTSEFNKKINELKLEIIQLQNKEANFVKDFSKDFDIQKKLYEHKMAIKDMEIQNKEANFVKDLDIQKELYEHKLVIKDHQIEILQLKLQLTQK
jgi:hypothetical protein